MREFDLIRRITRANTKLPEHVVIPPGDDMAMLRLDERNLLIATDQIIDGVHFDLDVAPLPLIARKAITRNVSDIAAMAALPVASVCGAMLPKSMKPEDVQTLIDSLQAAASEFGCPLIGGDTSIYDGPLALGVTVLARPDGIEPVLRSGSKVGDAIYVTGQLGGTLRGDRPQHLTFEPRVAIARALAGNPETRPTAMIDLSDGLARDLVNMLGQLGAELTARDLPVSPAARQAKLEDGRPGWLHAVNDGEDYELLFTASPEQDIPEQIEGVRVTRIGHVVDRPNIFVIDGDDQTAIRGLGWEHHA